MASRNAAAVVIALVGTLAVVAATIGVTHYFIADKELAQTEQIEHQKQTAIADSKVAPTDTIPAETTPLPETIVFKGENLERILADMAGYYGVTVKFNQEAAKSLQLYFEWGAPGFRQCSGRMGLSREWASPVPRTASSAAAPADPPRARRNPEWPEPAPP